MPKRRLVVVGNGMACASVVDALLKRNGTDQFQITVFGDEPYGAYDRMRVADVLSGALSPEQAQCRDVAWYRKHDITFHMGERAVLVSRQARTVYGSDSTREKYDQLIFATGSSPHVPPIKRLFNANGDRLPGALKFRTLDQAVQIGMLARAARSVVIYGGGVLGLEAARGLARCAGQVSLVHSGAQLMNQLLDDASARALRAQVERAGIQVLLERRVSELTGEGCLAGVTLSDGSAIACELLVIASGLIPNTWLAVQCGLSVERGIVVDNQLRSADDRDIYALGECAQHRSTVYSDAAAIREQAAVLAEHLTGRDPSVGYYGSARSTSFKLMGLDLPTTAPERNPPRHVLPQLSATRAP